MALILYLTTAVVLLWLANRWVMPLSRGVALALILIPCCFVGRALVTAAVYAPVDLPYVAEPLRSMHARYGLHDVHNGSLSDLAWQIIPWKKAVRWTYAHHEWPLVNPFMLCGDILAGAAQPAAYSPFTLVSLLIPFAASITYAAAIAFFIAGLTSFLLARELGCREPVALVASSAWMFSTQLALFILWPVGFTWAFFPLVLLGTRRVVHAPGLRSGAILCTAFVLTILAGHPESVLHVAFGGALYGLFELACVRRSAVRVVITAAGAGALALAICAIYLLPLLEAVPQTMEHAFRLQVFAKSGRGATLPRVGARLANVFFPFTFQRQWTSSDSKDIPPETAAVGSLVLAMAAYAIWRVRSRTTWFFTALLAFCLGAGVEWSPPLRLLQKLPLLDIAINERLSFVAAFAFCLLAALGLEELMRRGGDRMAGVTFAAALAVLVAGSYALARSGLLTGWIPSWAPHRLSGDLVPLAIATLLLLVGSRSIALVPLFLALLLVQRTVQEGNVYPTIPEAALYPPIPLFEALAHEKRPFRVAGLGMTMIPDEAALYGLEDPRGYEALTFAPLFETYPLWSLHQPVFFNLIDDPTRPFLSFLNVRYLVAKDTDPLPAGWPVIARQPGSLLLENPHVLERAFVPHFVRLNVPPEPALDEMHEERDFGERAWIDVPDQTGELPNGPGRVVTSRSGTDYHLTADMERGGWVVISQAAWKGWRAYVDDHRTNLFPANHAFLAVNVPAGHHQILLRYRPDSFVKGKAISLASLAASLLAAIWWYRPARARLDAPASASASGAAGAGRT